jgi:hypothetical protein
LSIKDDSTCRDQWNVILDARAAGLADSAAEKSFLADCVSEIKPGKDKLPPIIPPHLQPDSASRCHWIVAQIEGGRDEMTVSYKRYCPEGCHKLVDKDSTRHAHLCRDPHAPHVPGVDTTKPPRDTLPKPIPVKPAPNCDVLRAKLLTLNPASVDSKLLVESILEHCPEAKP